MDFNNFKNKYLPYIGYYYTVFISFIIWIFNILKKIVLKYPTKVAVVLSAILLLNSLPILANSLLPHSGYLVTYDNKEIGYVNNSENAEDTLESISLGTQEVLSIINGRPVEIVGDITLTDIKNVPSNFMTIDEISNEIAKVAKYNIQAYSLMVDFEHLAYVNSPLEIDEATNRLLSEYELDSTNETTVGFKEYITYETAFASVDEVLNADETYELLKADKVEALDYIIVENDTLWDLAIRNEMTVQDIYYTNEWLEEDTVLHPGDVIRLVTPVPNVSVRTTELVSYEDIELRTTEYIDIPDEYVTYRNEIQIGEDGLKDVTANIVRINGVETDRLIVEEVITKEPIPKIIERGVMNTPPKKAVGTFKMPASGRISDRFGTRGGRHMGIDIAAPSGTNIYASDGGLVTYSGWMGGYGNLVIIDHQNGYKTYYGHNRDIVVSKGEMVAQGQLIAHMGTTGDSTGNHLHFEVRQNNVPKNPFNYIVN